MARIEKTWKVVKKVERSALPKRKPFNEMEELETLIAQAEKDLEHSSEQSDSSCS